MSLPTNLDINMLQLIGEGQQGKVYRIDAKKCIKVYKKKRYYYRELKSLQKGQNCSYFPRLLEWGREYIIREYIDGMPLEEYLRKHSLTRSIVAQILDLFQQLKELGFRRMDIRLRHMLLTSNGKLKIIDPTNLHRQRGQSHVRCSITCKS